MLGDQVNAMAALDRLVEAELHGVMRAELGSAGVAVPEVGRMGALSLDASLTLALLREQSDERGVVVGDPVLLIAERLDLPHDAGSSWRVLWRAWLAEPLAELERTRMVIRMADGLLVRGGSRA